MSDSKKRTAGILARRAIQVRCAVHLRDEALESIGGAQPTFLEKFFFLFLAIRDASQQLVLDNGFCACVTIIFSRVMV